MQKVVERRNQNQREFHEQDSQLRRTAELPNCSNEVSENRYSAFDWYFSPTQLERSSDSSHDCDQLRNRTEANCDEDKTFILFQWPETRI